MQKRAFEKKQKEAADAARKAQGEVQRAGDRMKDQASKPARAVKNSIENVVDGVASRVPGQHDADAKKNGGKVRGFHHCLQAMWHKFRKACCSSFHPCSAHVHLSQKTCQKMRSAALQLARMRGVLFVVCFHQAVHDVLLAYTTRSQGQECRRGSGGLSRSLR
jgi:hypothetical protein